MSTLKTVTVLFVPTANDGLIGRLDTLIKSFTTSPYSHVAIEMFGGIAEALYPQLTLSQYDVYDTRIGVKRIPVDVPDVIYYKMEDYVRKILEAKTPYGVSSCLSSLFYTLFGKKIGRALAKILKLENEAAQDCSEFLTNIFRYPGINVLNDLPANVIDPQDFFMWYTIFISDLKEGRITWEQILKNPS